MRHGAHEARCASHRDGHHRGVRLDPDVYYIDRLPVNVDGELAASTPAVFRVVPRAISVFVPAAPAVSG